MSDFTIEQLEHFKKVMEPTPPFLEALIAEKKAHAELRAWVESLHPRVDDEGKATYLLTEALAHITRNEENEDHEP